ncbi:hypothetical protein B9Z55_009061 [Caenorhabditis nigoni]|uniref:RING-type domain-containing protein n=1 Tax=Caenorhabditis nigoni TaxID=1611254 RepID=A0A2G5UQE5_9PELO|nr:hypothetical protein B9Z55_009061 [Caenorhabditis nigoni]
MSLCWKTFIQQCVARADCTEPKAEKVVVHPIIIYKSLKGEEFIQKSDCYHLLYLIYSKCFVLPQYKSYFTTEFDHYFICSILSDVIKYHESQLNGTCEFVKYDEKMFVEIADNNESTMNVDLKLYESNSHQTQAFREFMKSYKLENGPTMFKILFTNLTNEISRKIDLLFKEVLEKNLPDYDEWLFKMYSVMCSPDNCVETVTRKFSTIFLPTNRNGESIVVRIFEEEPNVKFVMKSELFNAFNILYPGQQKPDPKIDVLTTFSYADVLRKYKDRISRIEFIRVPLQRSDSVAVRRLKAPSGDFCIPAADALFQLLNRLIFKENVFEKYKADKALLKVSLSSLEEIFTPYHRCIYFITVTEAKTAAKHAMSHLMPLPEEIDVKHIRNVDKHGFTVQDMKDELANLGVTSMFTEIENHAEAVYSEVFKAKKEEFLRTCDLSDAVEKCLLICIFERFPNLQLFVHTQNACHRLSSLFCEYCAKKTRNGKFKNTEWNEFSSKEAISSYGKDSDKLTHCQLTLPNGSILCNNFKFFSPEEIKDKKMTYFTMDATKRKQKKAEKTSEHLQSLSRFINKYPHENIYIRAIPTIPTLKYSEATRRVFAEEALEVIQILLKSRNPGNSENKGTKEKFESYHKKFERKSGCIVTINLAEFWYMLEEFDVDKTRITIVPDPIHELSLLKLTEDLRNVTLNVIGPKGDIIMRKEQVVLHMFQTMITELDWSDKTCETVQDCWNTRREILLVTLVQFVKSPDGDYVSLAITDYILNYMKRDTFSRRHVTESSPLFRLQNSKFDEKIPVETFISGLKEAGLDAFLENHPEFSEKESVSAWYCRATYIRGFLFHLFDSGSYDIREMIWNEVLLRQPEEEEEHRFQQIWKNNSGAEGSNALKSCAKCLRTSDMCTQAKKELKMTQNMLERYEKKAKRTDEVEIRMREMEAEMKKKEKEADSRELEMRKKDKEIEELKRSMLRLEAKNAKMQLAVKNHSISQNDLLEKITELSGQLKTEKEKNELLQSEKIDELTTQLEHQNEKIQLMELEIQQNEDSLIMEIRQKERGFEELRAALRIMSNEKESIQRENRNLRERIASVPEAPPTPPVQESLPEGPTHHRFALLGFQKIKDSLYHKKQLKQAKEMIEKLKSSSDLVEIHQIADYEYYQFQGKLLKYTKEVELNIQRIKETCDVSTVTPLPDIPEFSQRFMNLYWRIINNQPITSSEIELSDSECFICTEEMASDQKTLQCEKCKKVTHYECASKWLKINRSCPHCRRGMLDEEFPALSQ